MAKKPIRPSRSKDVPVTLGMLHLVRDELKADLRSLEHGMKSSIENLASKIESLTSSVHQTQLLAEEQRAENRIVMDGLTNLFARQERVETRADSFEKLLSHLKGSAR